MESEVGCVILSIITYFAVLGIGDCPWFQNSVFEIGITVISGFIIFFLAPLNHPNLNMTSEEYKHCKIAARLRMGVLGIIILIMIQRKCLVAEVPYLVLGLGFDAGALLFGKLVRQEVRVSDKSEKENA